MDFKRKLSMALCTPAFSVITSAFLQELCMHAMTHQQAECRKWVIKNLAAPVTEETGTNARFHLPLSLYFFFLGRAFEDIL